MNSPDIAIVGMACRLPMANSLEKFWNNLCQGKECLTRFNEAELMTAGSPLSLIKNPNFVPVKGILTDIEQFDAGFFGLTPSEASIMDPQQRLFLECAWEALEHSANIPNKCPNAVVSVFAGMADSCYLQENLLKNQWFQKRYDWFQARIATSIGTLSTQLSYRLNLQGRSVSLNTACSTGLVAVAYACQDLLLGHSDLALAGAVAIDLPQVKGYLYEAGGINSADGHCRPFALNANGTVFSNGVGVMVLKRLADAIADRDTIYAVIKGCGVNNDGADKLNYFAPSISGQAACIRAALAQANISAVDIGFMEAHGTATALGDLIEITALTQVYRQFTEKKQYCALGSVKGNIGHTDIAAGIASLIKVVLSLYYQKIPATLHFEQPNPQIGYAESPFFINTQSLLWQPLKNQQYAAVSAFGVGGTNSHLILGGYAVPNFADVTQDSYQDQLIIISAKSQTALQRSIGNLNNYVHLKNQENSTINLSDLAYTLQNGRDDFRWRGIAVGRDIDDVTAALNKTKLKMCVEDEHAVVFMFPGQGSQYKLMAAQLYKKIPLFAQMVNQYSEIARRHIPVDICEFIFGVPINSQLNDIEYAQVALFIIEYALAQLFIRLGIKPAAVMGHSSGEYVAACLAGIFSLEEAIFLVCQRGRLMASTAVGRMLAITCTLNEFSTYQGLFQVELAAHNATDHCVATGDEAVIEELKQYVEQQGKACQMLKVNHAFHSRLMEPILPSFYGVVSQVKLLSPQLPIISNLTGDLLTSDEAIKPEYWCQHLRHPVQFKHGIDTLIVQGYTFFVEVGPGQILSYFAERTISDKLNEICVTYTMPSSKQRDMDYRQFLTALGIAWQYGISIDWSIFYDKRQYWRLSLPTYPFERQRYWLEADMTDSSTHENIISEPQFFQPTWLRQSAYTTQTTFSNIRHYNWIIFKDNRGLSDSIISILRTQHISPTIIEIGNEYQQVNLQNFILKPDEKSHYIRLFTVLKQQTTDPYCIVHCWSCIQNGNELLTDAQLDDYLARGFYSILYITQTYLEQMGDDHLFKCAVVTQGSQQVLGDDTVLPVNATLSGICRVIMQEHPALKFQLMDVNLENSVNGLPEAIIRACQQGEWNSLSPLLAFRHGFQWRMEYVHVKLNPVQDRFKDRGVYLFTGGLGDIALILCEIIAKTVSQPIFVLLSRFAMPAASEWERILQDPQQSQWHEKISRLQCLLALGVTVSVKEVDITQSQSVNAIVQEILQSYGHLNGVIHAAGMPGGGLMQLKTLDMAKSVLAPKVHGTYHLAQALTGIPLDFVVLCSSISALAGIPSQVDYSSANACLDAFAVSRLFNASFVTSINWNTWKEIGMAAKKNQAEGITYLNLGNEITLSQGQQLFMQIMQSDYSQIIISRDTVSEFIKKVSYKTTRANLKPITPAFSSSVSIEEQLLHLWRGVLGIEKISLEDDFFAMGGHSLRALELVAVINRSLHCKLTLQDIYTARTISGLIGYINNTNKDKVSDILVPLRRGTFGAPCLFLCPPVSGMIFCYNAMLSALDLSWSIYGLQDSSIMSGKLMSGDLLTMAKTYYAEIRKIQPTGPYYLIGYSFGGYAGL